MSVLDGMARLLDAADCGTYSPDARLPDNTVPITVGGLPAKAGTAICVTTYAGGAEPDSRNNVEYPRLQVRVRHEDPLAAMDLERTTYEALQFLAGAETTHTLADGLLLTDCHALQSEAEPLGRDSNGRWEYVRNYQLTVERF